MTALGLTIYRPEKAFRGYTLFAPMRDTNAYLIDMQGAIVHRWQLPYRPGDYGYLLDNGHLLISGQTGQGPVAFGGRGGTLMELDWQGQVVWEYAEDALHHDFCRMPNGHTMVLGWEPIPAELASRVNLVFRAYRYGPDFPGLQGKALEPQRYAWLNHLYR